jgi:hypothetical protein
VVREAQLAGAEQVVAELGVAVVAVRVVLRVVAQAHRDVAVRRVVVSGR